MSQSLPLALGLDFGTESVRALLVDLKGNEHGSAAVAYRHGQITDRLPGTDEPLPADFALQHPADWIDSAARAVRKALRLAGADGEQVISIGVDFTSCTMLPALRDGTPLCLDRRFADQKYAWPKLWKHHGAKRETDRINQVARRRKESWLDRYGGIIGLEWFFPKVLETLEHAPAVYDATEVWLEAGDWFVWQLVGSDADDLPRSTCQAGYKAMWSRSAGYPSTSFFRALNPKMAHVVRDKMPGQLLSPGESAGGLGRAMAKKMNLKAGTPVSAAVIDAHAGVPGAGVSEPGTLVMVLGTSNCHMLNAREDRAVPGVAGVVEGGILPGMFGYETGQAAAGDAFDWLRRTVGGRNFDQLTEQAAQLDPGADGVICLDWMNGCRTPLMDGSLTGAFTGLTLAHGPHHLYRSLLEASAFGVRWIVEILQESGVPVKRLVATGGLPHHNRLLVQIYADVLGKSIVVPPSKQGPALGAAILGVLAAGSKVSRFRSATAAIRSMAAPQSGVAGREAHTVRPQRSTRAAYNAGYRRYRALTDLLR
ncbi:MAG: ribulokinase [Pirellulales bacterium]